MITSPKADDATIEMVEQYHAQVTRLQGEARVMLDLLSEALGVIDTIEPECATEQELLDALKDNILAVLGAKGGLTK